MRLALGIDDGEFGFSDGFERIDPDDGLLILAEGGGRGNEFFDAVTEIDLEVVEVEGATAPGDACAADRACGDFAGVRVNDGEPDGGTGNEGVEITAGGSANGRGFAGEIDGAGFGGGNENGYFGTDASGGVAFRKYFKNNCCKDCTIL